MINRRVLAVIGGALATLAALMLHLGADHQNSRGLLEPVFVPLSAVFVVDYSLMRRGRRRPQIGDWC